MAVSAYYNGDHAGLTSLTTGDPHTQYALRSAPRAVLTTAFNTSFATGVDAPVGYTTQLEASGITVNGLNTATTYVTAQTAGLYFVSGSIRFFSSASAGERAFYACRHATGVTPTYANRLERLPAQNAAPTTGATSLAVSFLVRLAVGESVGMYAYQATGAAMNPDNGLGDLRFSVYMVST